MDQNISRFPELLVELQRLEWAKELTDESLRALIDAVEYQEFNTVELVIEVESEVTHVWFLITGRLQAKLYDVVGKEILKDTFVWGSVVGLFSLGLSDGSHLQVEAAEPSKTMRLTLSGLLQLTAKYPDIQLAMFRLAANLFQRYVTVDRSLPKPSVVGIVHHSEASRPLVVRLARRLRVLGELPATKRPFETTDHQHWQISEVLMPNLANYKGRRQAVLSE